MTTDTDYASNSKGNTGVALGATALGLAILGPHLTNGFGLNGSHVTKEELAMAQSMAVKDSEIALLKADQTTNTKIIDTYKEIMGKVNDLAVVVQANKDEQYHVNTAQAVYNGTNTATLGCLQNQVNQLYTLTQLKIPSTNVCPLPQPAPISAY